MAGNAVKAQMSGVAHLQNMLNDVLDMLSKLFNQAKEKQNENAFREAVQGEGGGPQGMQMYSLQASINGRVIKALEEAGIHYVCLDVEGSTQNVLLVPARDKEKTDQVVNDMRLQLGYTIDNREELEAAIILKGDTLHPSMQEISGLDGAMTERVMHFAEKYNVPAAMEKQEDGTYSVFSNMADAGKMSRFLFAAAWDLTGPGGGTARMRNEYAVTEREEISHALERAEEKMSRAYIFSATMPGYYIHIEEEGYTVYRNGRPVCAASRENAQEEYGELLKLQCKSVCSPVYMLEEEVMQKMGPNSNMVKNEVVSTLFADVATEQELETVGAEKFLRTFLEKHYQINGARSIRDASDYMYTDGLAAFRGHMEGLIKEDPGKEPFYRKVIRLCEENGDKHMEEAAMVLSKAAVKERPIKRDPVISMEAYQETMDRSQYAQQQERGPKQWR